MRSFLKVTLTIGVIALVASPALAQRPGFGAGGGFGGAPTGTALLRNRSVQEELKMKEDQVKKLDDTEKVLREKIKEETYKALATVLDADQMKRFKQIEFQQGVRTRGAELFTEASFAKDLGLTAEQKEKIATINEDFRKEMREAQKGFTGGDFQAAMEKMNTLRKESMDKCTEVLTKDQKGKLKDLQGEAFELRQERPGGKPGKPERKP